jgi:hypothetical protein
MLIGLVVDVVEVDLGMADRVPWSQVILMTRVIARPMIGWAIWRPSATTIAL